jgi:hypothetical protein
VKVAISSFAPASHFELVTCLDKVFQQVALDGVANRRTRRYVQHKVFTTSPLFIGTTTPFAVVGFPEFSVSKRREVIDTRTCLEDDTSTIATVATVGSAKRDIFLPPEAHDAVPSVARLRVDSDVIDEHGRTLTANGGGAS